MATPQSTTSHEDHSKKNLEQITFRFCAECSNMLYPKEDEDAHKLQFTCRTCQYTEEATSTCVFRNVLNNAAGETAGVTQDVGSDPTVGVTSFGVNTAAPFCTSCPPSPALGVTGAPILCLCCGTIVACRTCGVELFAMQPTTTTTTRETTPADMIDSSYDSDEDMPEPQSPPIGLSDILDFDDYNDYFDVDIEYGEDLLVTYQQPLLKAN